MVDLTGDHRSYTMEHDVHALLNKHWRVLIAGLPEAKMSDQLIISRALFLKEYKPKLVAITISPVDLIDDYRSVKETEAFAFFSKYIKWTPDLSLIFHDQKSEFGKSLTYSRWLNNILAKSRLDNDDLKPSGDDYLEGFLPISLGKPFARICPGQLIIAASGDYSFHDNTDYYRDTYKNFCNSNQTVQTKYLQALLSYLAQQHIKVVVFNMPLTSANKNLLPSRFYSFYTEQVYEMCKQTGADYIDLDNDWKAFSNDDFIDVGHLNLPGGLKLTRPIALFAANKFHWKTFAELRRDERKMF